MKKSSIDKSWQWGNFTFGIIPNGFALGFMIRPKFIRNKKISFWVQIMFMWWEIFFLYEKFFDRKEIRGQAERERTMKKLLINKSWCWKNFVFGITSCDFALGIMLHHKFYKDINLISISFRIHIMWWDIGFVYEKFV
ncbi:MAG: hypothetical protein DRO05_00530 [Thermoproteota archaeon]|nr:MAG: hypothetical protein DRO05_00530 [Candidatus Korarchaeota archaeon]